LDSLNKLLDVTVPSAYAQGGTLVIPGHGRIADHADVVYYRNMVATVSRHDQAGNDAGRGEGRAANA